MPLTAAAIPPEYAFGVKREPRIRAAMFAE